jgi:hypothetical protein
MPRRLSQEGQIWQGILAGWKREKEQRMETLRAIAYWYQLAKDEAARRDMAVAQGWGHPSSYDARIRSYEETARALRLELETGEVWCSCHLRPKSEWDTKHFQGGSLLG